MGCFMALVGVGLEVLAGHGFNVFICGFVFVDRYPWVRIEYHN